MKAIIFDVGGVLIHSGPIIESAMKEFGETDAKKFWEEVNFRAIPVCRGELSLPDMWKKMVLDHNKDIPDAILDKMMISDFEKSTVIDNEMIELVRSFKGRYRLGIISNSIKEHSDLLKKTGLYDLFDVVVLSHEVKMTKDSKEIFNYALKKLKAEPEECVFIDDIQSFVDNARELGFHAIHFINPEQLKEELTKVLG